MQNYTLPNEQPDSDDQLKMTSPIKSIANFSAPVLTVTEALVMAGAPVIAH